MTTLTEGMYAGEFIGERALGDGFHNDEMTVISGQNLKAGAIVGTITASGKVMEHDPAATGGTAGAETASGILVGAVDATGGDKKGIVLRRGPATVNGNDLTYKTGMSDPDKVLARADLLALGIKVL